MLIEEAIRLARDLVLKKSKFVAPGGIDVAIGEIVSACHSSSVGRARDEWVVTFHLDWGMTAYPDVVLIHVDSKTGEARSRPIF